MATEINQRSERDWSISVDGHYRGTVSCIRDEFVCTHTNQRFPDRDAAIDFLVAHAFCQNAQMGTYGHECGAPAVWIASRQARAMPGLNYHPKEDEQFHMAFCQNCREYGHERHGFTSWREL
jgi:hypothetical protein